jgi:hypothetical protein
MDVVLGPWRSMSVYLKFCRRLFFNLFRFRYVQTNYLTVGMKIRCILNCIQYSTFCCKYVIPGGKEDLASSLKPNNSSLSN